MDKLDFIKIKNICPPKTLLGKLKARYRLRENIFKMDINRHDCVLTKLYIQIQADELFWSTVIVF